MRRSGWWLGFAVILVPNLVWADDHRPEDIIRAAIVAAGGNDSLGRYPAGRILATGMILTDGTEVPVRIEQIFHIPGRSRTLIRTNRKTRDQLLLQVVNGARMRTLLNGATIPTTDSAAREAQMASLLLEVGQLTPLLSDRKFTLKHDHSVRGNDSVGLILHTKGMPDLRLGFDRKSGHLIRINRKAPDPETAKATDWEQVFGNHKTFQGMIRPTTAMVYKDGIKILELTTETFTPLETTEATAFAIDD